MNSKTLNLSKKVMIEFFVMVFIIGFFSKTFVNYWLPKVNTVMVYSGSFKRSVPIEVSLEYKDILRVRVGSNAVIQEYFVEVGKRVKKGDAIFRIDDRYGINDFRNEIPNLKLNLEREKNHLNSLKNLSFQINEMKLSLIEKKIETEVKKLSRFEELAQLGAVSQMELENMRLMIEEMKINLLSEEIQLRQEHKDIELQIKETENRIQQLEKEIESFKRKSQFYSQVKEDGVYYSEIDGIILTVSPTNQVLYGDQTIVEIAVIDCEVNPIQFVGYIPERYRNLFEVGDTVDVKFNQSNDFIKFQIREMFSTVDGDRIQMEGELLSAVSNRFVIRRKYNGEIGKMARGNSILPKSAVITAEFREGEVGKVYLLEISEGILGRKYTAKEVEIVIEDVGDSYVSVKGLEGYHHPRVITNLSYRIKDGVKVFHGN